MTRHEVRTRVGRAIHGEYESFGLRVFRDLVGNTSYIGLMAFGITGRRLSRDDEAVLDDLAVSSHVTEPRVWPIKIARIVASIGRSIPGYVCGTVALDSDLVGGRVAQDATDLLLDVERAVGAGGDSEEARDDSVRAFLATRKRLIGFGVPFRDEDERVLAFRAALARRGRSGGAYWQLAERFWRIVKEVKRVEPNIIGATSAICLDLGFKPHEVAPMAVVMLQPTFLANAVEGALDKSEILRRLPDDAVRYVGPAPRASPRAKAT